ncbi:hypothetical protein ACQPW1_38325 [Nocardia sp. CA-128927]|uniref:hypothetical protein n=1 Tax=Nocardia sp. CA-128927 TaxID=3239975 RepID=UPI003D956720
MDGYDSDRDGFDSNARGRIFETGLADYYKDSQRGYHPDSHLYKTMQGRIQFDHIKRENGLTYTIEDKSGRIEGDKDVKQLVVLRVLLETGVVQEHTLRSVEHEGVSERCQELINGLKRDFPDRFTHQEISRTEARAIWALGHDLDRARQVEPPGQGKQLELPGVGEKARAEKAQELQKQRDKQAALAKARAAREKFRTIQKFRDGVTRGRAEAPQRIQAERVQQSQERAERAKTRDTPEAQRIQVERIAAEKAVREFQGRLQSGPEPAVGNAPEKTTTERESPEAARARVEREAREQVLREFPFPVPDRPQERETIEIGERPPELNQAASVEREAERTAAEKARETAAQQREADAVEATQKQAELDQKRDAAYREMLNQPQVPEHIRLALSHAQAPEAAVREPPGHSPSVERGGTGQTPGRDRGPTRDR